MLLRALTLAMLVLLPLGEGIAQEPVVLHITVTVADAERRSIPVGRHVLLISANPATAVPRRILTSPEGTADVRLLPGNYTVESDRPATLNGRSYEWIQTVDISPGRRISLELTADNARVGDATLDVATPTSAEPDRSSLFIQWQDSVVALWTPRVHATGFLVDGKGLVVTSHRALGDATSVEVQVSTSVKVAAKVLAADAARDVVVLWIDPAAVVGVRPVPLACTPGAAPGAADSDRLVAFEAPLHGPERVISGSVPFSDGGGGPVFAPEGVAVGLTSIIPDSPRGKVGVVPAAAVCDVLKSAMNGMSAATPPSSARLPVEPPQPVPVTAARAAAAGAFSVNPYRISSSDFDIVFITPVLIARAESKQGWSGGPDYEMGLRAVTDFGEWSDYVSQWPRVLLVRVTPRLVEGFWTKVARGAAETQGVSIPPIKRFRAGFSGLRIMCGDREVTPIHPFTIEQPLSETESIAEGLYVFDPAAIGPHCGEVSVVVSSVKQPERPDTRVVEPAVIRRIEQDFQSGR